MRTFLILSAMFVAFSLLSSSDVSAQSLQCLQQTDATARSACAADELDNLDDRTRYWRREAHQTEADYSYFAARRERCRGEAFCIAREFQNEIAELQSSMAPPQRQRAALAYTGPVRVQLQRPNEQIDVLLDRVVRTDSRNWMFNSYDQGSIRNVRIRDRSGSGATVQGDYTFNGGVPGWVRAHVISGALNCVQYWDTVNCQQVNSAAYAQGVADGIAIAAMSSSN